MAQVLRIQVARGGQVIAQHEFDLSRKVVRIGRSPSPRSVSMIRPHPCVHAVLELAPSGVALVDLGTAAGTTVNGTRVNRVSIGNGDQITIGAMTLFVTLAEQVEPVPGVHLHQRPRRTGPLGSGGACVLRKRRLRGPGRAGSWRIQRAAG